MLACFRLATTLSDCANSVNCSRHRCKNRVRRRLANAPEPVRNATERISGAVAGAPKADALKQTASGAVARRSPPRTWPDRVPLKSPADQQSRSLARNRKRHRPDVHGPARGASKMQARDGR